MKLLDILGHNPNTTDIVIAKKVGFRYYNYVSTVKNTILKPKGYLSGPSYWIDLSQISYNKLNRLIFFIMFPKEYDYHTLSEILKKIECWSFIYPLEESTFNQISVTIYSTNHEKIINIFEYLKNNGIIFYYDVY